MSLFDDNTIITPELIEQIAPDHERSSCSDEAPSNWYQNGLGFVRCIRCSLQRHAGEPISSLPVRITVQVHQAPKTVERVVHEVIRDE